MMIAILNILMQNKIILYINT